MSKQAIPAQRVGDNGYYYFTYDNGAEYEVKTRARPKIPSPRPRQTYHRWWYGCL